MEYSGTLEKSVTSRKCKRWKKKLKKVQYFGMISKGAEFKDRFFPDGSSSRASDYCRNPDGDIGNGISNISFGFNGKDDVCL